MSGRHVGVVGLGVMGANLARNFASRGFSVAGYDRDPEVGRRLAAAHPEAALLAAETLSELVGSLERPRRIILLVNAGKPVDAVLDGLDPLLDPGDIVVDGGNSLHSDTDRRLRRGDARGWHFVGMGVSGGSEGALKGPAMMPGGDRAAWDRLRPALEAVAARADSGPCVAYCGAGSAGHFVKMVHNGIEYGDMQLISEVSMLLRGGLGRTAAQAADAFDLWNRGELESYLVQITADVLRTPDPADPSRPLVDAILDQAGQKGTGKWTVLAAVDLGVPIPTISAALDARVLSASKSLRLQAEQAFEPSRLPLSGITEPDLANALYASKIASYAQGFSLLGAASEAFGYGTDPAEIARIWTGGCIIRARFLGRVREAFAADPKLPSLALAPLFVEDLCARLDSWRRVVAVAAASGWPVPGLASSLAWFDALTQGRGGAALIQAQRDYFGSHGFERLDSPGVARHADWVRLGADS
jgi:6-phosphogluconate dehydrogenase